jgi:hypothetical protein
MALIKIINVGEELIFDLANKVPGANTISVVLTEKAGRKAVLKISADRSIPINHVKQATLPG